MNWKDIEFDIDKFYKIGCVLMGLQGLSSAIIYFMNLSNQTFFTTVNIWSSILFSWLISYLFYTLAWPKKTEESGSWSLTEKEIKDLEVKNGN
jgi:hypothetical protein